MEKSVVEGEKTRTEAVSKIAEIHETSTAKIVELISSQKETTAAISTALVNSTSGLTGTHSSSQKGNRKKFPFDRFGIVETLPRTMPSYKRHCDAVGETEKDCMTTSYSYLPESVQNMIDGADPKARAAAEVSWEKWMMFVITAVKNMMGQDFIRNELAEVRFESGEKVITKWDHILNLTWLGSAEEGKSHAEIISAAWKELKNKVPNACICNDPPTMSIAERITNLQSQIDAHFNREKSNKTATFAGLTSDQLPLRLFLGSTEVNYRFDTGADVSFIGASSPLGKLIFSLGTVPSDITVKTPARGSTETTKPLWAAVVELRVHEEKLPLKVTVHGLGTDNATLFIGKPDMTAWQALLDTSTRGDGKLRVRIRALEVPGKGSKWFDVVEPPIREENGKRPNTSSGPHPKRKPFLNQSKGQGGPPRGKPNFQRPQKRLPDRTVETSGPKPPTQPKRR